MGRFDKIGGLMKKEGKKKYEKIAVEKEEIAEGSDEEALSKIVERMKKKYDTGAKEPAKGKSSGSENLREVLSGRRDMKIGSGTTGELALYDNSAVRFVGSFYGSLQKPLSAVSEPFKKSFGPKLENDLNSSGMNFSVDQYIALVVSATAIVLVISILLSILFLIANFSIVISLLLILIAPMLVLLVGLMIPQNKAASVGMQIEKQLPFALRHMSIEIRAGIGIFKTMSSIANSNYGALSTDFKWILSQIEKGVSTEDAFEGWANRTRSRSVKRVVSHLVRALRTGGNLSEVMVTIAEDVTFDRKTKIADYAQKLNLIGLFFMMFSVVFPAMITVLTAVGSSPTIASSVSMFNVFTPEFLMLMYFLIIPMIILMFVFYMKSADPG
ncbi:MAG: type II secretion system F family protein [Candidatus Micrarchaeota archaeon]